MIDILSETVPCKQCGAHTEVLAIFPGGICLACHEIKFNAEVKRNGGALPRPDFSRIITKSPRLKTSKN